MIHKTNSQIYIMRSQVLNILFSSIRQLSGVGDKTLKSYENLCGNTIRDLVFHLPHSYVDRSKMPPLNTVASGDIITAIVTIGKHIAPPHRSKAPYKVITSNGTGIMYLVFFNGSKTYLEKILPFGEERVVSGRIEKFDGIIQMVHPDYMLPANQLDKVAKLEAIYPLTKGISNRQILRVMGDALNMITDLPEWNRSDLIESNHWESWKKSIMNVHNPEFSNDSVILSAAEGSRATDRDLSTPLRSIPHRNRLAYDELLAYQLALALSRKIVKKKLGRSVSGDNRYRDKLLKSLPFSLTAGQQDVLKEISADMADSHKMVRLLQGDVGSGKTIVALLSMLNAVEEGLQTALMVPTEILAQQHSFTIEKMLNDAGLSDEVRIVLLTGKDKGKKKQEKLTHIADGFYQIVIGTHALFQETVVFKDLSLVVIDEQHRFGVKQRLALASKGDNTDLLLMTATPIPRTLTLTLYGDMDVSILREKPAGRKPIETRIMPSARVHAVAQSLERPIKRSERIYWVCPLVEENDQSELIAVEERYKYLRKLYPNRVGMVHGKMKSAEKDKIMLSFKNGEFDILIATTVIEVGVDVPQATIMVIEQAERFGLSQLHQLRGRVGRGEAASSCILLYGSALGESGKKRLQIMRETEDGFIIAEEDLAIRGSGDVLGTKQSGMPEFKIAILPEDSDLLFMARDDVKDIIDGDILTQRKEPLANLLCLFGYDTQASVFI